MLEKYKVHIQALGFHGTTFVVHTEMIRIQANETYVRITPKGKNLFILRLVIPQYIPGLCVL